MKQYIEKLKESKLREENLKASLDKVNKSKETLIKVNDEQAKNLKEWENFPNKDQYLKIKEDYDRILKNSTKNDLLNRYNNLERKFIDLKNEFKHYLKKSNINSKNNLSKNETKRTIYVSSRVVYIFMNCIIITKMNNNKTE